MPTRIAQPTRIAAAGNEPKLIDEYIGRVNSETSEASIAHMRSPPGWVEAGQTPEFEEFTIVLKGMLRVEHKQGSLDVYAGQAVIVHAGEWVRYSTLPLGVNLGARSVIPLLTQSTCAAPRVENFSASRGGGLATAKKFSDAFRAFRRQ